MTFVSDSWMMRYAARSTAGGIGRAVPITNACVGTPACVAVSISTSSWARPGAGLRESTSSTPRKTCRMPRNSRSVSRLVSLMVTRASCACSGRSAITCAATPAWTLIVEMLCETTSCNSRAIRSRSSVTRCCVSSSRRCRTDVGVPVRGERRSQQEEDLERGDQGAKPYPLAGTPKTARHGSYATGSVAGSRRPAVVFRPQPWRYAETVNHHRGPTKSVISWPTTVKWPAGHDLVMFLLYQWLYGTWNFGWGG